jgi:hypothetical protein
MSTLIPPKGTFHSFLLNKNFIHIIMGYRRVDLDTYIGHLTHLKKWSFFHRTPYRRSPSPDKDSTTLTRFFEPSGGAQQVLAKSESISNHLSSHKRDSINYSKVHKGIDYSAINDFGAKGIEEQAAHPDSILATSLTRQWLITSKPVGKGMLYSPPDGMEEDVNNINGKPGDFLGYDNDKEYEFGHDAHGTSSLAASTPAPIPDTATSPLKQRSALCSTSFTPVVVNPLPSQPRFLRRCSPGWQRSQPPLH